MLSDDLKYFSE